MSEIGDWLRWTFGTRTTETTEADIKARTEPPQIISGPSRAQIRQAEQTKKRGAQEIQTSTEYAKGKIVPYVANSLAEKAENLANSQEVRQKTQKDKDKLARLVFEYDTASSREIQDQKRQEILDFESQFDPRLRSKRYKEKTPEIAEDDFKRALPTSERNFRQAIKTGVPPNPEGDVITNFRWDFWRQRKNKGG
jgi:hypothetical protein